MTTFGVVDLTQPLSDDVAIGPMGLRRDKGAGQVDLGRLQKELTEIRDALHPVLTYEDDSVDPHRFGLAEINVKLTIGVEGSVWFVAKGSVDASISLTFKRGN